jgi:hypothetical protein
MWVDDDGYDGVQYDTFYGSSAQQLEADEIRRECYQAAVHAEAAYDAHAAGLPHDMSACGMAHSR